MKLSKIVLVGMSGGVDSSVAALLLKARGYNVIGAFMKNFSETKNSITSECSWKEERKMAKIIASILNISLITIDSEKEFKKNILQPMFNSYSKGLTPNQDILCNKIIKFPILWKKARELKADYIATGHYARIKKTKSGFQLLAGKDKAKDQSYFLSELSQRDLKHALFPLGNLTKSEVRKIAKKHSFPNYNKPGTSGICFVGQINLRQFLKQKIKEKPGKILSPDNKIIGTHPGIMYYTIGQRIGPRLGFKIDKHLKEKYYIADKNKKTNTISIAPVNHQSLKKQEIKIKNLHLINPNETIPKALKARIRHLGKFHKGELTKKNKIYYFIFKRPIEAIAEGQFLVLYKNDKVIASGEII